MYYPTTQAGMIEIDHSAGNILQKYLVSDYLDGYLSDEERWAFEHLIRQGEYAAPGLGKSGIR